MRNDINIEDSTDWIKDYDEQKLQEKMAYSQDQIELSLIHLGANKKEIESYSYHIAGSKNKEETVLILYKLEDQLNNIEDLEFNDVYGIQKEIYSKSGKTREEIITLFCSLGEAKYSRVISDEQIRNEDKKVKGKINEFKILPIDYENKFEEFKNKVKSRHASLLESQINNLRHHEEYVLKIENIVSKNLLLQADLDIAGSKTINNESYFDVYQNVSNLLESVNPHDEDESMISWLSIIFTHIHKIGQISEELFDIDHFMDKNSEHVRQSGGRRDYYVKEYEKGIHMICEKNNLSILETEENIFDIEFNGNYRTIDCSDISFFGNHHEPMKNQVYLILDKLQKTFEN